MVLIPYQSNDVQILDVLLFRSDLKDFESKNQDTETENKKKGLLPLFVWGEIVCYKRVYQFVK